MHVIVPCTASHRKGQKTVPAENVFSLNNNLKNVNKSVHIRLLDKMCRCWKLHEMVVFNLNRSRVLECADTQFEPHECAAHNGECINTPCSTHMK